MTAKFEFPPISEFRSWLESLEPDELAGTSYSCTSCPYANFLRSKSINFQSVDGYDLVFSDGVYQKLPDKINRFIAELDGPEPIQMPVTAAECLAILERLGYG